MVLELQENLFGLCLSFLDIREYNWMLNLPRPEAAVVLCAQWKKESKYMRNEKPRCIIDHFNGKIFRIRDHYTTSWFNSQGVLHRNGGPALIELTSIQIQLLSRLSDWPDGNFKFQIWYHNGKRNRTDGPAIIYEDGKKEWWMNGVKIYKRI